jgi:hypothetical protein
MEFEIQFIGNVLLNVWKEAPTNYMQQSPSWEADSRSNSREIPSLLWKPNFHCHVYKVYQSSFSERDKFSQ